MSPAIYLGLIKADASIIDKIQDKHHITLAEVRDALQWPAMAQAAEDDDPEHGWRVLAIGSLNGREVFAALVPEPDWAETMADTWWVKTARWL